MITNTGEGIFYSENELVNLETGEIVRGMVIPADSRGRYIVQTKNQMDAFRKKIKAREELQDFNSSVGSFTLNIEKSVRELFESPNFSDSEKVHIMYLGTYVNYGGYLQTKNNKPMSKKILMEKVRIRNKKRFYIFYEKMIASGFIQEEGNKLLWNKGLCFKGIAKQNGTTSGKTIKTFDATIQSLYESERHSPKSLSIVFKLLPYVNKFHNVICHSPSEKEYDRCAPYQFGELGRIIGEKDNSNLKVKLLRLKIGEEFIFSINCTGKNVTVFINPCLVWQSTWPPPSNLIGQFKAAKEV